jgi:hypothetical protein
VKEWLALKGGTWTWNPILDRLVPDPE